MSLFRRLSGHSFYYGIGEALPRVIGFLLIPVYAVYLTPSEYGILEVATLFGAFLTPLMRFGLPGAVARYYYEHRDSPDLRDYVTTVARSLVATSVVVGATVLIAGPFFVPGLLPGIEFHPIIVLTTLAAVLACNADLQRRLIQAREQSKYAAALNTGFALTSIVLNLVAVVVLGWGVPGMLLAQVITATVFLIQAWFYLRPDLGGVFRRSMLRSSLIYGAGVLPSHLVVTLGPLGSRGVLNHLDSMEAVGIVALATRFVAPLTLLGTAFQRAYAPLYFDVRSKGEPDARTKLAQTTETIWFTAASGALAVALLGPPAIEIMTPARYHPAAPLVPILCIGVVFHVLYVLFGAEIMYSKKTYLLPFASLASAVSMIGVTLLLARPYGALGLAWATSAGFAASALVVIVYSLRLIRLPLAWGVLARLGLTAGAALVLQRALPEGGPWQRALLAVLCLAAYLVVLWLTGDPTTRRWTSRKR